jgi:CheY-like chemotaxis protein
MKILIIEDDPNNMLLITILLKKHGHETIEAFTGKESIKKASAFHPDLILIDIMLHDMDAVDVIKAIRKIKSKKDVPIIAITSSAMGDERKKLIESGCSGYFETPQNPLDIMDEIEKILGEKIRGTSDE